MCCLSAAVLSWYLRARRTIACSRACIFSCCDSALWSAICWVPCWSWVAVKIRLVSLIPCVAHFPTYFVKIFYHFLCGIKLATKPLQGRNSFRRVRVLDPRYVSEQIFCDVHALSSEADCKLPAASARLGHGSSSSAPDFGEPSLSAPLATLSLLPWRIQKAS